ncbi:C2 calcium-dependent membrane targeting [Corchorus capsularis]|uniref:C2 calcium-dependent membrane targeting n=1 Tax=Corchorus capsularis TaxID=210143 RepID=A0A1R3IPN3_COCAP|nr:C2 calcium-dependent membrane targeting [Corchorus capsularis]
MAPPNSNTPHSRILEINIISAEALAPVSRNMKTYAIAWIKPDEKLATGVDQTGGTDPTWNDKFNFRVEDKFFCSEDAAIVVEIYAAAWVKDALIGSVNVLIKDIFNFRSLADANIKNSTTRSVTLQVRRPSGRPQGILNMELTLCTDENKEFNNNIEFDPSETGCTGTELTMEENSEIRPDMGSMVNCGDTSSEMKGNNSMVNGGSLCNSDVGPSASVVAAAIAHGLYVPPVQSQAPSKETRKITEWTKAERGEVSLDMKLERWRTELSHPVVEYRQSNSSFIKKGKNSKVHRGDGTTKLFSCFGNAFGCEISIACGGSKKRHGVRNGNGNNRICHLSSVDDNYSQSIL